MKQTISVMWFRRDLRLEDNNALFQALKGNYLVLPLFIFDKQILDKLEDKNDKRVAFIHKCLIELQTKLTTIGKSIFVAYGTPKEVFEQLLSQFTIVNVFCNNDYEPDAIKRDSEFAALLALHNCSFKSFKDQVIFEKGDVLKKDSTPYTIYTPYARTWRAKLESNPIQFYPSEKHLDRLYTSSFETPRLAEIGFNQTATTFPNNRLISDNISTYHQTRDFPALDSTSRMGIHLRFGTISIRKLVSEAIHYNDTFLGELIWREFFMAILAHFPHVVTSAFKPAYNLIEWRNNMDEFALWCEGKTGYPLVDAGMRELNATGFMHNRVRMVTASFLCKHLLIDWRLGEAYFANKLLDYDMAANIGNWQWAAGCGCDAAPYFRVFNPTLQAKKFDSKNSYIKKWVPEFETPQYPTPIVEHSYARDRALEVYKRGLNRG